MLSKTLTYLIDGTGARLAAIEVDIRKGLPSFALIGTNDVVARESRERVRAALLNAGFEFPQRRITVNIADSQKILGSPSLDLPIAHAILRASDQLGDRLDGIPMSGELGLDGSVRPIRGALALSEAALADGYSKILVPERNAREASLAGITAVGIERLDELSADDFIVTSSLVDDGENTPTGDAYDQQPDLADLRGHAAAITTLQLAAAGGHNLLFKGPPGCGKTMLARRLPQLLPPMTRTEALEVTRLQSVAGHLPAPGLIQRRPFRAPHHTVSTAGMIGGGSYPTPGEVTLATNGVLFLDELSEFSSRTLESLRQPLDRGVVTVTRSGRTYDFPARFLLVGATDPCPCGGAPEHCRCAEPERARYLRRLSSVMLNHFDLYCEVKRPTRAEIEIGPSTNSAAVREKVIAARAIQSERYKDLPGVATNAQLDAAQTRRLVELADAAREELATAYKHGSISLRDYDCMLRVARTIADLEGQELVNSDHVELAFGYLPTQILSDLQPETC